MKEKCDEKRKARYLKLVCIGILGIYAGASYYNSEPLIAQEETGNEDESRQLSLEEKADQANQDQGTLTSSTLNETIISSSEQQESSTQNDSSDHQENNVEPLESENSLPPQEKTITVLNQPNRYKMSNQYLKSVKRSLRSHLIIRNHKNSTLTEKTKEPLVHSEVDNSQERKSKQEFNNKPRQILLSKRMLLLLSLLEKSVKKHELLVSDMIYTLL